MYVSLAVSDRLATSACDIRRRSCFVVVVCGVVCPLFIIIQPPKRNIRKTEMHSEIVHHFSKLIQANQTWV